MLNASLTRLSGNAMIQNSAKPLNGPEGTVCLRRDLGKIEPPLLRRYGLLLPDDGTNRAPQKQDPQ